jgi:hypothetical protein
MTSVNELNAYNKGIQDEQERCTKVILDHVISDIYGDLDEDQKHEILSDIVDDVRRLHKVDDILMKKCL